MNEPNRSAGRGKRHRIFATPLPRLTTVFSILILGIMTAVIGYSLYGCYTNPATGKEQLSLISESQEIQMGREADRAIVAQLGLYPDSSWQRYVRRLGDSLAAVSERPGLPWTFRVVDDPTVNAFALPGGFIYVTRGMLYHIENEAELAGVIGHEIGHVTAKHSVNQMSKQQLVSIGLIGAQLLEPEVKKYGQLINTGLGLLFLKFSRDDEREADLLGLRYMYRDNYDPREMDDIFIVFDRMSGDGSGRIPTWLSTHPAPADRVQRIRSMVSDLGGDFTGRTVGRETYLARLDGVSYGNDPREGYFTGSTFYHPGMKFRFTFPNGWNTVNQKQAVIGGSTAEDANIQITLEDEATPSDAARDFFGQEGVSSGVAEPVQINSLDGISGDFSVRTEQTVLAGNATFISYGGQIFAIIGYSTQTEWPSYRSAIMGAIRSFQRLTDPAAINVEPKRISTVRVDRSMTLDEFNSAYPSTIPMDELLLINQLERGEMAPAGHQFKRVTGQTPGD